MCVYEGNKGWRWPRLWMGGKERKEKVRVRRTAWMDGVMLP